jgi:hypothetical protein
MYQARNGVVQGQNWAGTPTNQIPLRETLRAVQERIAPTVERYGNGNGDLYNSIIRTGSEMLPGVGDLVGIEDLQNAAQGNDWGGIGLGLLSAIPGIPAIGRGGRGARRAGRLLDDAPAPSAGLLGENAPAYRVERSQDLAPTDTPESLRAQGYEIDPATNTWARTVGTEAPPVDYPIRAFHGSPHSFDRFSLDKIGTGEGAQAYGHGLYFAESEGVARQYRDNVKNMAPIAEINQRLNDLSREMSSLETGYRQYREPRGYDLAAEYDDLMSRRSEISNAPGSMYEVGINADPETFLNYDAPLSSQPRVREALTPLIERQAVGLRFGYEPDELARMDRNEFEALRQQIVADPGWEMDNLLSQTGAEFYDELLHGEKVLQEWNLNRKSGPVAARERLQEYNIPGIRYSDGFSRRGDGGPRTSNYVLFDDELVKIIRKYGISGLGLGAGLSAFGYNEPAEQSLPDL